MGCDYRDTCRYSFSQLSRRFCFYEKWKKVANEAEQLKEQNLQTQLESLKAQVNPHFCSIVSIRYHPSSVKMPAKQKDL
jgi:sensor histidine kinase YesM